MENKDSEETSSGSSAFGSSPHSPASDHPASMGEVPGDKNLQVMMCNRAIATLKTPEFPEAYKRKEKNNDERDLTTTKYSRDDSAGAEMFSMDYYVELVLGKKNPRSMEVGT